MLYKLDPKQKVIKRVTRIMFKDFGWEEREFQELLFDNLNEIIQTEELLVIMQSRRWQEEPDLMAVDEEGDLWIFELKVWETKTENILQALRYGQKFGQFEYEDLNQLYRRHSKGQQLLDAHRYRYPDSKIIREQFNQKQHFVVIANGLDIATRQAISFWVKSGLDIKPWIYRLYKANRVLYLEFNPFRGMEDNPFEDIESNYYVVNTNQAWNKANEREMLKERKAAAYYSDKETVRRIQYKDRVFLYSSGKGIIAGGIAKSKHKIRDYKGDSDVEYYVELGSFHQCDPPISPSEIRELIRRFNKCECNFRPTCWFVPNESGREIWKELVKRSS